MTDYIYYFGVKDAKQILFILNFSVQYANCFSLYKMVNMRILEMSFVTCKTILIRVFLNNINVNQRFILAIRQFFIVNESELENMWNIALLH